MRFSRTLIDLSGTLHIDNTVTRDAVAALAKLRASGRDIRFVTNTTKESGRHLFERLRSLGFDLNASEIFSSLAAAKRLIQRRNFQNPLLLISDSALEDFFEYVNKEQRSLPGDALGDSTAHAANCTAKDAVVVGLAPDLFHYEKLTEAMRVLLSGSAELIAIHKAKYYARKDGLALGPGAIIAGLEYSTGKKATVVGKPTREFFLEAIHDLVDKKTAEKSIFDINSKDDFPEAKRTRLIPSTSTTQDDNYISSDKDLFNTTIMIGDDPWDDVEGPMDLGMSAILVQTGKYRCGDEQKLKQAPLQVCADFAAAVDWLLANDV